MLTMCFEANLTLVTHDCADLALVTYALYYIHACALLARLYFASQDEKKK